MFSDKLQPYISSTVLIMSYVVICNFVIFYLNISLEWNYLVR